MSLLHSSGDRTVAQVTSRRHPLAFSVYLLVLVLGAVFVFHLFGSHQTQNTLFPGIEPWVISMWKWMMCGGAALSLFGLLCKERTTPGWPDIADLLHLEAIGAVLQGFGMLVYTTAAVFVYHHMHKPLTDAIPGLVIYGAIIAGLVWRGVQAIQDARRLERLATMLALEEARRHAAE